jgi:hypothetical protein
MNADPKFETADSLLPRRDAMYTPLEEAVEELHKRRRNYAGRTPGRDWLPDALIDHANGFALLARFIPTPNFESMRFLRHVDGTGLKPVISGYTHDKFVPQNPLKRGLARMGFHGGENRHGHPLVEYVNVMNGSQQGRPMRELQTLWGQSLISFHHELLTHALNGNEHPVVFDSSPQYERAGSSAAAYYRKFLFPLCVADGVLVEDYLLTGKEFSFTRDVVLPAFDAVSAEFGMRPLIVRLTPPEEEDSPHWFWYPNELKAFMQERMERVGGKGQLKLG